jgi:hypothetical protein
MDMEELLPLQQLEKLKLGKLSFLQQVTQKGLNIKHILNATEQTREENKNTRDDFLREAAESEKARSDMIYWSHRYIVPVQGRLSASSNFRSVK